MTTERLDISIGENFSLELQYAVAADMLLYTHAAFVVFVISGLLLVFFGKFASWRWVSNPWFRLFHLLCIGVVVVQSWLGLDCPLTSWEMALRARSGDLVYTGSFISHWVERVLYYQAPEWVFTTCYTIFGSMTLISWFWVRPRPLF